MLEGGFINTSIFGLQRQDIFHILAASHQAEEISLKGILQNQKGSHFL